MKEEEEKKKIFCFSRTLIVIYAISNIKQEKTLSLYLFKPFSSRKIVIESNDEYIFSRFVTQTMASMIFIGIITGLVIIVSLLLEFFFSLFEIIFKKPISPKGAVEIDPVEHIYAHPDYADSLQDPHTFDVQTIYDVLLRGLRLSGDKPHFSYRTSSDQPFKSYTYK